MSDPQPVQAEATIFSVETLLKYMGNDAKARAVVAKIVRDACAPGMAPIQQAGLAMREQRLVEAGKILHGLRGSIGTLGAKRLVNASLALEQALTAGQPEAQLSGLFAALENEYSLVMQQAEAWLSLNSSQDGATAQA